MFPGRLSCLWYQPGDLSMYEEDGDDDKDIDTHTNTNTNTTTKQISIHYEVLFAGRSRQHKGLTKMYEGSDIFGMKYISTS